MEEQLVVFELGPETYGVDISCVREIIRMHEITEVPGAPSFVEGVINLRGRVIPVVDLRRRFGLAEGEHTKATCIIVVQVSEDTVGMVVDAVSEVLRIPVDCVEPPPPILAGVDSEYIRGIAKLEERLIILLEIEKVLSIQAQDSLQELCREAGDSRGTFEGAA